MRARLLVALAAGLLVGAADPAPDLGEVAESGVIPPGSLWWEKERSVVWEFAKDGALRFWDAKWTHISGASYIIDGKSNPPRIEIGRAKMRKGIYWLNENRLVICLHKRGLTTPPSRFAEGRDSELRILKRLK